MGIRGMDAREIYPKTVIGWARRKWARMTKASGFMAVPFERDKNFETLVLIRVNKVTRFDRLL